MRSGIAKSGVWLTFKAVVGDGHGHPAEEVLLRVLFVGHEVISELLAVWSVENDGVIVSSLSNAAAPALGDFVLVEGTHADDNLDVIVLPQGGGVRRRVRE